MNQVEDRLRVQSAWWMMLGLLTACSGKVDQFTLQRVVPRALVGGDLEMVCALGESTTYGIAALPSADKPPRRAEVIGYATGAMCAELEAWEFELQALRAEREVSGEAIVPAIKDARLAAERAHAKAARRFYKAFEQTEAHYGPVGDGECPRFNARRDELTYLVGLVSGMNAVLHDKTAGSPVGVPLDVLPRVARGAACLDDEAWWHSPGALMSGAWATVPGSGPADADPWALMEEHAAAGESSGVRVARALQVLVSANAGRDDLARGGMSAHAESLKATPVHEDWKLLDEYARRITLHQSDLAWTAERGHRTPSLGELPGDKAAAPADPFAADPFGADPFGAPAPTPEEEGAPAKGAEETEE